MTDAVPLRMSSIAIDKEEDLLPVFHISHNFLRSPPSILLYVCYVGITLNLLNLYIEKEMRTMSYMYLF